MREILFRGKRVDNGEWVEGAYFPDKNGAALICTNIIAGTPIDESAMCIAWGVDSATIEQFIGMTDKNGKQIFEGDILRQKKNGVYGLPFSVVFDDGGFMWNENGRRDFLYQSICDTCEVIGNIHDNPEMLEGE